MNKTKLTLMLIIIISTVIMMISMRGYSLTKVNVVGIYENAVELQIINDTCYNSTITIENTSGITKNGERFVKIKYEPFEIRALNTEKYCISAIIVSMIIMFMTSAIGSKLYMQKISWR